MDPLTASILEAVPNPPGLSGESAPCSEQDLPYIQGGTGVSRKRLSPRQIPAKVELPFRDNGSGLPFWASANRIW